MNELLLHIDYLLREHECVTVPGMGAFIATVSPAAIADTGEMTPPALQLAFNSHINHNDGLLVASYVRRYGIAADEAARRVAADEESLYDSLRRGTREPVGMYGHLLFDQAEGLKFERAAAHQWLQTLRLQPVLDMAREQESGQAAISRGRRLSAGLRSLRIAASVAVALAIGFVASTPTIVSDDTQVASPGLEQFTPKAPAYTKSSTILIQSPADPGAVLQPVAETQPQEVIAREEAPVQVRLNDSDRYFFIVASLADADEAGRFIARHGGNMKMLQTDGRYRVYALSDNNSGQLKALAAQLGLNEQYPGAWVFHK